MKAIIDTTGLVVYYTEGVHPSSLNEIDYEGHQTGFTHIDVRERHPWFITKYKDGVFYDATPLLPSQPPPTAAQDLHGRIEELESKLKALGKYL
jgi:hypothetical protein